MGLRSSLQQLALGSIALLQQGVMEGLAKVSVSDQGTRRLMGLRSSLQQLALGSIALLQQGVMEGLAKVSVSDQGVAAADEAGISVGAIADLGSARADC